MYMLRTVNCTRYVSLPQWSNLISILLRGKIKSAISYAMIRDHAYAFNLKGGGGRWLLFFRIFFFAEFFARYFFFQALNNF